MLLTLAVGLLAAWLRPTHLAAAQRIAALSFLIGIGCMIGWCSLHLFRRSW
jgi:hypothetical protein